MSGDFRLNTIVYLVSGFHHRQRIAFNMTSIGSDNVVHHMDIIYLDKNIDPFISYIRSIISFSM